MRTSFSSHNGGVYNTAVVLRDEDAGTAEAPPPRHAGCGCGGTPAALGGQLGKLASALDTVGWNHHQVPAAERVLT